MPPDDPLPKDDPPAAPPGPAHPDGLETLRAFYDRRRRRVRLALTCGALLLALLMGTLTWLFIRYPLRAMRERRQELAARDLESDVERHLRAGNDRAAAEIRRKQLAMTDRDKQPVAWARIAGKAAEAYIGAKLYDEAREILVEALPWAEKHPALGGKARETLGLMGGLGNLEGKMGHDEAAEDLLRRVLERHEQMHGDEDRDTLMALNNYGWFLVERSRLDEAEPLLVRSMDGFEAGGWGKTSSMAHVLDSVAHLRDQQGRLPEAVQLQRRAVKLGKKLFAKRPLHLRTFTDYLADLEARAKTEPERK